MYISRKALLFILGLLVLTGAVFAIKSPRSGYRGNILMERSAPGVAPQPQAGMASDVADTSANVAFRTDKMTSSYLPTSEPVRGGSLYLQDTSLSLVSKDPVGSEQKIRQVTTELGGFLVSSSLSRPEEGATATIIVRVPTDKLEEALRRFEESSERVVSKSIQGRDVTQQFQDLEAKLATITRTQERLEELFERTNDATALLQIQQQLMQLQDQKDHYEGQRRYLAEAANLTKVTLYVASDELALPYVPAQPWRPEAIFKQAVRSLVGTLRGFGTAIIWAAVYLPLALPVILVAWWLARRQLRR